jgi:serine protease Do
MRTLKIGSVLLAVAGISTLAVVLAPSVHGQSSRSESVAKLRQVQILGRGARIGASVRDLEDAERKGNTANGVFVDDVRTGSPAEKSGMRRADIVTRYDGENVRSVVQFTRLVQETPAGRTVTATVVRDGRSTELSLVPEDSAYFNEDRLGAVIGDRIQERVSRIPFDFDFDFDFQLRNLMRRGRLGVSIEELTPQLATYFGAKDGVLVSSVVEDSPASRAGLKAGDVIVSFNGQTVSSSSDLTRSLRDVRADAEVTIGIVRERKEVSLKTKLEAAAPARPVRPIRPVRSTRPARPLPA